MNVLRNTGLQHFIIGKWSACFSFYLLVVITMAGSADAQVGEVGGQTACAVG